MRNYIYLKKWVGLMTVFSATCFTTMAQTSGTSVLPASTIAKEVKNEAPQSCSFSPSTGFSISSSSISGSGSTVTFSISFNSNSGATNWYAINQIATINGPCKPVTTNAFTVIESGRPWLVAVTASGTFNIQLQGGTPPSGSITLAGSFGP